MYITQKHEKNSFSAICIEISPNDNCCEANYMQDKQFSQYEILVLSKYIYQTCSDTVILEKTTSHGFSCLQTMDETS